MGKLKTEERMYFPADELRVDQEGGVLEGYAAVFGRWSSKIYGIFKEKIRAGAFAKTIREGDIRALFNHDPSFVLGRNKNDTLELKEDKKGLWFRVQLPDTSYAQDVYELVKRGDVTQNSFGFRTVKDEWNDAMTERELIEAELQDVSPVTYPAYPQTKVSARAEQALGDIGIDYDALTLSIVKAERGIELTVGEADCLRSAIDILGGYVPEPETDHSDEEPGRDHSETTGEPEQSTPTGQNHQVALRARELYIRFSRGVKS